MIFLYIKPFRDVSRHYYLNHKNDIEYIVLCTLCIYYITKLSDCQVKKVNYSIKTQYNSPKKASQDAFFYKKTT